MYRNTALSILIGVLFSSCGTPNLKPDPVQPTNYPTAEFTACGERWVGLGACAIRKGERFDSIDLAIQGYAQGTMQVVSEACAIDDVFRYSSNQSVKYSLDGNVDHSCLLSIIVLPEFPSEDKAGVPIRSFKGQLWVRVIEQSDTVKLFETKIPQGLDANIELGSESAHLVFRGCGVEYDADKPAINGKLVIKLSDLFADLKQIRSCVLSGRMDIGSESTYLTWMVWSYDEKYIPLSTPSTVQSKKKISVIADEAVSVLWLDDDFRYSRETEFDFDPTKPHILRALTIGGRSVVGEFKDGVFIWKK